VYILTMICIGLILACVALLCNVLPGVTNFSFDDWIKAFVVFCALVFAMFGRQAVFKRADRLAVHVGLKGGLSSSSPTDGIQVVQQQQQQQQQSQGAQVVCQPKREHPDTQVNPTRMTQPCLSSTTKRMGLTRP